MAPLSKNAILAQTAPAPELVDVPEWAGSVLVRVLTGTERDALFAVLGKNDDGSTNMRDFRARLVSAAVLADGAAAFTRDEVLQLDDTQPTAVLRLFSAAQRVNKLRPGDLEAATGN
jgi:hypothetical protein